MAAIKLEDIVFTGIVTLIAAIQLSKYGGIWRKKRLFWKKTPVEIASLADAEMQTTYLPEEGTRFARKVGMARRKHKIDYPRMTGDENFERVLRAQQNCLEFFPVFMVSMWMSSLFFHQVIAAVVGLIYVYSRHNYFEGYCKSVKDRLPGFKLGVRCLMLNAGFASIGFITLLFRMYADIDLAVFFHTVVKRNLNVSI